MSGKFVENKPVAAKQLRETPMHSVVYVVS